jgi:hypothetical protein
MIGQKRQVINLEEDVEEQQQPEYLSKGKGQQRFVETAAHHHHYFGRSAVPIGPEHAQRPPGGIVALFIQNLVLFGYLHAFLYKGTNYTRCSRRE